MTDRTERLQPVPVTPREKEGLAFLVALRARELAGQVGRVYGTDVVRGLLREACAAVGFDPDAAPGTPADPGRRVRASR